MRIRKARRRDLDRIQELWWELTASHFAYDPCYYRKQSKARCLKTARRWHRQTLRRRDRFMLVAEDRGEIIGYLHAAVMPRPSFYLEKQQGIIYSLVVSQKYRRQGAAQRLLRQAAAEFRKRKIRQVVLNVERKNQPARSLYRGAGFELRHLHLVKPL